MNILQQLVCQPFLIINIKSILESADNDTRKVIWLHIIKICAYIDPSTKAREILKENMGSSDRVWGHISTPRRDQIVKTMWEMNNNRNGSRSGGRIYSFRATRMTYVESAPLL
jgi:hypothetical protein